jgi:succinate-semialdehyde dehydrogenase / glutarate-semialdehyde dehydrogenase
METDFIKTSCYVDGQWLKFEKSPRLNVYNPANQVKIADVPLVNERVVNDAILASSNAKKKWKQTTGLERARFLRQIGANIRKNEQVLAELLTTEQGKPIKEALAEIRYGASYFEWFSEEARRINGEIINSPSSSTKIYVHKEPVGVVAIITPWNFPHAMIARKMAAALAAGCTVVIKPAPETPLSALALAKVCEETDLPPGVINVITGNAEVIGNVVMNSTEVRKISFTGSTSVGKLLIAQSASNVKRLTLELGGNAPFIVCEDANIDKAVTDAVFAKFRNAGQTCICVNRFLVHKDIANDFCQRLNHTVSKLEIGDGLQPTTDIGPLISMNAKNKVLSLLEDAKLNGACLISNSDYNMHGQFLKPIILTHCSNNCLLWNEEIFGPLAAISEFSNDEEAIKLANSTSQGLAAYIYSNNHNRLLKISEMLEYGMIGCNNSQLSIVEAPFGGIKESGYGREGGKQGIDEYLNLKYVSIGID